MVNLGMCSFMYIREENVYVVAVTRANANAMLAFTVTIRLDPAQIPPASLPAPSPPRALASPRPRLPSHPRRRRRRR